MDVVAGPSGAGVRPYLRFPPPPPFPPEEYDYAYEEDDEDQPPPPEAATRRRPPTYRPQENLYEEIGAMRLEEEVRYVHSKHLQVLDELNLSMEAMIMPVMPGSEQVTADLLSPASSSIDSGFSSSSTGTNSLGRPQPSKRKSPGGFWKRIPALVKSSTPKDSAATLPVHHPPHTCCKRKSKCPTTVRADEQRRKKIDYKM